MRLAAFASLSLLSLAACVHSSHFYMPDGTEGFVIRCGGRFNDMAACYNRAYEECRGPYKILGGTDDQRQERKHQQVAGPFGRFCGCFHGCLPMPTLCRHRLMSLPRNSQ